MMVATQRVLYEDTMCKDTLEFSIPNTIVRASTQQEQQTAELVAAYNANDVNKVARMHEFEKEPENQSHII